MEPKYLVMREDKWGVELHWRDRPVGDSLQGWYPSKTKARAAAKLLPSHIVLELPPRPEPANV